MEARYLWFEPLQDRGLRDPIVGSFLWRAPLSRYSFSRIHQVSPLCVRFSESNTIAHKRLTAEFDTQVQLSFEDPRLRHQDKFGGSLLKKSNAREARPLSYKELVHLVLRSSQARGEKSMRRGQNFKIVRQLVTAESRRHGVKLIEFVNVGNHLHLLVKLPSRAVYKRWIKRHDGPVVDISPLLPPGGRPYSFNCGLILSSTGALPLRTRIEVSTEGATD